MVKDPSTGKRISRPNPGSAWQSVEAPQLRIVEQALFERVQFRKASAGRRASRSRAAEARRVLSGLLRCGCCGGGMAIVGSDRSGPRIQCSIYRGPVPAAMARGITSRRVERLVVDALRLQLANPDLISEYVRAYREERQRVEADAQTQAVYAGAQPGAATATIKRTVESIAKGLISDDEAREILVPARQEKARLEAELRHCRNRHQCR